MRQGKASAVFGAVVALSLIGGGCATKKHVQEAIAPVQNQVNDVEKQTKENHQAIGDLDRQVATADEKATDAGKRAGEAAEAANKANQAAAQAAQQAEQARLAGQRAQDGVSKLDDTMQTSFQNLDNYKLVSTEHVYFRVGASKSARKTNRSWMALCRISPTCGTISSRWRALPIALAIKPTTAT